MRLNREGRFFASTIDAAVRDTGPNNLCTVILCYHLEQEWTNGEWADVSTEDLEVTAYCYIEKRSGALNDFQIDMLKTAYDWPGDDPFWFEDQSPLPQVQLDMREETYNGQTRMKVGFIHSATSTPSGVQRSNAAERQKIKARLGSKLRAIAGPSKPVEKKLPAAAAKPTPPSVPKAASPSAPKQQPKEEATMEKAWAQLVHDANEAGIDRSKLETVWFAAIKAVCGHDDTDRVTPEQWREILEKPFPLAPADDIDEEEIPY